MTDKKTDKPTSPRTAEGRFMPGTSGNPGGRKVYPPWFADKGEAALRYLCEVADGTAEDESITRADACVIIVDRVYGKPKPIADGEDDGASALEALVMVLQGKART